MIFFALIQASAAITHVDNCFFSDACCWSAEVPHDATWQHSLPASAQVMEIDSPHMLESANVEIHEGLNEAEFDCLDILLTVNAGVDSYYAHAGDRRFSMRCPGERGYMIVPIYTYSQVGRQIVWNEEAQTYLAIYKIVKKAICMMTEKYRKRSIYREKIDALDIFGGPKTARLSSNQMAMDYNKLTVAYLKKWKSEGTHDTSTPSHYGPGVEFLSIAKHATVDTNLKLGHHTYSACVDFH